MTRILVTAGLTAVLLAPGAALAAGTMKGSVKNSERNERIRDSRRDDSRQGRERFDRWLDRRTRRGQERIAGFSNDMTRTLRHTNACQCSSCGGKHHGGFGDQTVVLVDNSGRGNDTVVVVNADGRRRSDRGYGFSLSQAFGEDFGFYWDPRVDSPGHRLHQHAPSDCREPGRTLASSGDIYLRVRADGTLAIQQR